MAVAYNLRKKKLMILLIVTISKKISYDKCKEKDIKVQNVEL